MWIKCSSKRINLVDIMEYTRDSVTLILTRLSGENIKLTFDSEEEAEEVINSIDAHLSETEFLLDFSQFFYGKKPNEFLSR